MVSVTIQGTEVPILCEEGENLLKALLEAGVYVDNPCNGAGTCGKCNVRIWRGGKAEECLACTMSVSEDMTIELLREEREHKVLTAGYVPDFAKELQESGYGIAVDIGTTTVAASLIDLRTGEESAVAAMLNPQKRFGTDVLTRITYEYEHRESGITELQRTIVEALNTLIAQMCGEAAVNREEIREIDVSANCTMMHMLLGADARPLGRAPYRPVFTEAQRLAASDIGIRAGKDTVLYCLPQASAYIGADLVAGAYVCGLRKEKGKALLADIGTNGEIVLSDNGRLTACSCAAGPALEGMNIRSGMRAAAGAVEDVMISAKGVCLKTIGDVRPEGICGSGILAAVRELLRSGIVKKTGAFVQKERLEPSDYRYPMIQMNGKKRAFLLCEEPEILITQEDVRQVQLAKGAIRSGLTALLQSAGIRWKHWIGS